MSKQQCRNASSSIAHMHIETHIYIYKNLTIGIEVVYAKQRKPNTQKVLNHSFISRKHCPIKDFKISYFIQSSGKPLINKEQSLSSCQYRLFTQKNSEMQHISLPQLGADCKT